MKTLILLAGEQAAPNLLPVRHYAPKAVIILHTSLASSLRAAQNLKLRLAAGQRCVRLEPVDAFDVGAATATIMSLLAGLPHAIVNVTGGTKPMSMAALAAARTTGALPIYVRSQGARTTIDEYTFDTTGAPKVARSFVLDDVISLDDYLTIYFGTEFQCTDFTHGVGEAFERALFPVIASAVDEVAVAWKHNSGAVDVDFVVRCNNQIGIIEAKTGNKARSADGIKQLAVAGGQRFFGTYTQRFLVIDQELGERTNVRSLAAALGIHVVQLPSFQDETIAPEEQQMLVDRLVEKLGQPAKAPDALAALYRG